MTEGFNPLRWKCAKDGCFNEKRRPKIEVFADCFPRRINFGDVDGMVEYGGAFCLLEWKGEGGTVHTGQRLSYQKFTRIAGNIVFIVSGDAATMVITGYSTFFNGRQGPYRQATLQELKKRLRDWVRWIDDGRPTPPQPAAVATRQSQAAA